MSRNVDAERAPEAVCPPPGQPGPLFRLGGAQPAVLSCDAPLLLDEMRETIGVQAFDAKLHVPAVEHVRQIQTTRLAFHRLGFLYYLRIEPA